MNHYVGNAGNAYIEKKIYHRKKEKESKSKQKALFDIF